MLSEIGDREIMPQAATWLDATQGGGKPFMFTMGRACLNRALFPCQDTPKARATWSAIVTARRRRGGMHQF